MTDEVNQENTEKTEKKKRGGKPCKPDYLKAKNATYKLYHWEREIVRHFIKFLHKNYDPDTTTIKEVIKKYADRMKTSRKFI